MPDNHAHDSVAGALSPEQLTRQIAGLNRALHEVVRERDEARAEVERLERKLAEVHAR